MTQDQLLEAIRELPLPERIRLLEAISLSVYGETRRPEVPSAVRLRGMLKTGAPAPTDAELGDAYADHLLKKYA